MTYLDQFQTFNFTSLFDESPDREETLNIVNSLLEVPGILGIHCLATNKTYLTVSFEVGTDILDLFDRLELDYYQVCPELEVDFRKTPSKEFVFVIIKANKELDDYTKLKKELLKIQKSWPYKVYKDDDSDEITD